MKQYKYSGVRWFSDVWDDLKPFDIVTKDEYLQRFERNYDYIAQFKNDELITNNWKALIAHVARHAQETHKKLGRKKGDNFLCPYCNSKHGDMKAVLRHLVERNCEQNRCGKYCGKKLWKDFTEANW